MDFFSNYFFFQFQILNIKFNLFLDKFFLNTAWHTSFPVEHYHETWEIYFIHAGNMTVNFSGERKEYTAGSFALIPPNTYHCIETYSADLQRTSVRFCYSIGEHDSFSQSFEALLDQIKTKPLPLSEEAQKQFYDLKDNYSKYCNDKSNVWQYPRICASGQNLFTTLLEDTFSVKSIHTNKRLSEEIYLPMLIEFFMRHATDENITVSDLANSLNYSVVQTNRIIKNKFNKTFRTLVCEIKIKKAKYYLKETNFSINKISEILGYKEAKYFNASFKEAEGITPTAWRKQQKEI